MRAIVVGSIAIALAAAGVGAYYVNSSVVPQDVSMARWGNAVDARRHGIQLIRDVEVGADFEGRMVTVDFAPRDERWTLRGTALQGDRRVPFFATLEQRCEDPAELSCWGLEDVTIDGREVLLSRDEPGATEVFEAAAKDVPTAETAEMTASLAPPTAAVAEQPQQPASVWRVVADAVNARTGPGTDNNVAFVLSPETPLYLVREQDGWGLFDYQGEGDRDTTERVWVFMDLVEQE